MHDVISPEARELIARADAIVKRADSGDQDALIVTRKIFDELPTMWDAYGNLAAAAERAIVELFAGESALTREALRKKLAAMRAELAGPEVSPLERLLAQRVVACWLLSYHADFTYARALKQHPVKEVEPYHRMQDRAARQYLKALKSLAVIRRLLVPQVQVNIGERQVNIASGQVNVGAPTHLPESSQQELPLRWP